MKLALSFFINNTKQVCGILCAEVFLFLQMKSVKCKQIHTELNHSSLIQVHNSDCNCNSISDSVSYKPPNFFLL